MKNRTKIALAITGLVLGTTALAGCTSSADTVSENLSVAAENFEIERKITFYNGITGNDFLIIEGRCSIEDDGNQLEVTCKVADDEYIKDFLHLSDNVTYFSEQLETADASVYHYRVIFKPEAILPSVEVQTGQQ
jgi:hypothetical protein